MVREEGDDGGFRPGYEGVGAWRLRVGGDTVNSVVRGRGTDEGDGGVGGGEGGEGKG